MGYPIGAVLSGSADDPCCCGGPTECCLYPWPGLSGSEVFPSSDLALTVILYVAGTPITMTLTGSYEYTGADAGVNYIINKTDESDNWLVSSYLEGEDPVVFTSNPCLIADDGSSYRVEDEFPDTLTTNTDPTTELFRVNPCFWAGTYIEEDLDEFIIHLQYVTEAPTSPPVDFYGNPWPTKPFWMYIFGVGTLEQYFAKDDPQNGPQGTYGMGVITVS